MKLSLKQYNTYYVDWFTDTQERKEEKVGLNEYLAQCMGIQGRLDLFEAPNDTQYSVVVKLDNFDKGEFWVNDRLEQWNKAKENKGFEHWRFYDILKHACERYFIPPGYYVIKYSY